jgi:DNA-binding SARP family transcriptional activator/TolB-like protein/Tfp pilus assembly protein PilF
MPERYLRPALLAAKASGHELGSVRSAASIGSSGTETPPPFIVRVHLVGSMQATTYLGNSVLPRGKKARALLAYLCLATGARAPRGRLASMLWDRVPESQARASFRQSLRELSAAMGNLADELIKVDRETVSINTALCWVDASAILSSKSSANSLLSSDLIGLCTGRLLDELDGTSVSFDHWLLGERTRFGEHIREVLEAELSAAVESKISAGQRALMARRLIGFDATHEGACRILMGALADMGERAQAIREYERCRQALQKSLDVEPSSATRAVYDAVRTYSMRTAKPDNIVTNVVQLYPDPAVLQSPGNSRHGRLRVGVLPFLPTGPASDDAIGLSMAQEIAAALARFRWFDVIAPVSLTRLSATHLTGPNDLDYVVEGALSSTEEKLYIGVRLLDLTQYARPVWSERFDLGISELDQLNEVVINKIVARIDPVILFIEGQQRRREHSGATGSLFHAIPLMYSMEREKFEEAGNLIRQAIEKDPNNAMAAAWGALWQVFAVGQGWQQNIEQALATAQALCLKAIKIDPDNAEALGIYAHMRSFLDKDFDAALHYFDRSLRLNPNLAFIWALSAATFSYIGEPDIALKRLERYCELAPFDPYFHLFESIYCIAYVFKGDYEQTIVIGRRAVRANPDFVNTYKPLIAALGHLNRLDEAKLYIEKLLSLEPNFTIERFGRVYPIRKPEDRERYQMGLRLAGVPES